MSKGTRKPGASSRFRLLKRLIPVLLFLLLSLAASEDQIVQAAQSTVSVSSSIRGRVIDAVTGQPIKDATIVASGTISTKGIRGLPESKPVKEVTRTEEDGSYRISLEGGFYCNLYAYSNDPSSPGYDYLPKQRGFDLGMGKDVEMAFELVPAASVILEGELLIVDSPRPPAAWTFTVLPEKELPGINGSILTYGPSASLQNSLLNVNSTHVIVPANTSFKISVAASPGPPRSFVIDDPLISYLSKGEGIRAKIGRYSIPYNLKLTKDSVQLSETRVAEAEQKGFYILAELRDLAKASALIEDAEKKFTGGLYGESYADLREAYTKAAYIYEKVRLIYASASASVPVLIVFLAFTSTALSYLLFENWVRKVLAGAIIFVLLIAAFFYTYAGCRIFDVRYLLIMAAVSISVSFLIAFDLPRRFSMTVVFSLAKRNIKRRTIRFTLTLIPITVLVMSFVALTSFSTEYGFTSATVGAIGLESRGLLVRQPLPMLPSVTEMTEMVATFKPIETSALDWLQRKPETALLAPKVENFPSRRALGSLSFQDKRLRIFGVLGLLPSIEAKTTGFDKLLVEGQGRCLRDDEEDAIMISARAAQTLNVSVGEYLLLNARRVELVGLLDDDHLSRITDFDGSPLIPRKLVITVQDEVVMASIDPCDPSELVITNWQTALKLFSSVSMSRIDVLVKESVDPLEFARQVALERDYWVWAAVGGKINLVGIMHYLEAKGLSIFIPWLIVILNVIVVMVNAIYERRREVAILSSVGLNPTHITSLFGAEALIIGIIGGGIGYLLGLSSYRIMALLPSNIEVRQKISFEWFVASLAISVTAVLIGAFIALKASVAITPSLLRRWTIEQKAQITREQYELEVPIRLREDEVGSLFDYIKEGVQDHVQAIYGTAPDLVRKLTKEREEETDESHTKVIEFKYCFGRVDPVGMFPFRLRAERKRGEDIYRLVVQARPGESESFDKLVTFIRMLVVDWSARR